MTKKEFIRKWKFRVVFNEEKKELRDCEKELISDLESIINIKCQCENNIKTGQTSVISIEEIKGKLLKDEYGLYVNAENYSEIKSEIIDIMRKRKRLEDEIESLSDKQLTDFKNFIPKKIKSVLNPEMIFSRDKFEIFTHVILAELNMSRIDSGIILADLFILTQKTKSIFDNFDNKISIEENVKKFYDNK